ncbi:hypothetical protein AOLI_G00011500 [Acnodon oligacanthus]
MSLKNQLYELWFGLKFALGGELFGSMSVSHSLTPDTPEGYIVKRSVQSALVGLTETEGGIQRVYEAKVLSVDEAQVHVQLSSRCCTELQLERDQTVEMEIQFQLDRIWFCEMHKAVDILPDLRRVLPDLSDNNVPVLINSSPGELNEKQQAAMDFILQASDHRSNMAPLLIYGPFGTGKTFTLAKITLALAEKPQNKILICTHTNSSADLYVKDHFHNSVTADHPIRPLRIKAQEISLKTTDPVTLQYCHLSKYGPYFDFPDRKTLDATRIIITTTALARSFHNMQLPSDYFSHIFIDEASQMLECQALMALGLAGEKTQVVLAGDHMQMGPKLFSVGEDKRSDHTLLNRLFHYYQTENTITAMNNRIIFSENYRSTNEIVEFVSTHFYVGKKDVIKAKGNVPPHPDQNTLQFYYVRGECHLDKTSLTWFNQAQINCVVDVVLEVMHKWPEKWQPSDPASVCVLSQGSQVYGIRKRLKEFNLHAVTVENAENVQGKQFRVIIITTVHTKDSLKATEHTCLEFFNDMRVLNTAMTRAQSQVIVVGDAAALCCSQFGKCWRLWRSYIKNCICNGSFYPEDFTLDHLDHEILELSTMIKTEEDDSSDDESITSDVPDMYDDPILKELLDEHNDLQIKLTEEGLFPVFQTDNLDNNLVRHMKEREPSRLQPHMIWQDNSNMYKCELVLERYDSGYAKPLDEPTLQIEIKGRKNVGQSLSGDVVIVEILTSETFPPKGKVIEVLEHAALSKEFVCTIDNNDDQVMTPINICVPKFFTPFWKDKPNHIAIRNPENWSVERFIKINEEARRTNLFVVKFLKWHKRFQYPLGIVVKVLPRVSSLEDGLKVLDIEYQLKRTVSSAVQEEIKNLKKVPLYANGRKDFRELLTFTVDGPTSQDLDDAISVRDLGQCYEIGIHIADVASFVAKDSELDKYARQQGTAFYLSEGETTYMFPKDLSTKDFSLLPNCERRCISLMTEVDKQTNWIQRRMFFKSVICSKKKLTYSEVEEILRTSGDKYDFNTLEGCLAIACHFAEVHRKHRKQDDWCYKSPDEDVVLGRRRSHRLVEELMIMFNHTVADRLLSDQSTKSLAPLSPNIHTELNQQEANSVIAQVPTKSWKHLLSVIKEEKWDLIVQTIEKMTSTMHTRQRVREITQIPATACNRMQMPNQEEHYIDMSLELKQGKTIEVQLGTDTARGLLVPAVQLLIVNPKFEICLEHTKNPIVSFSKYALCSSRPSYNTYMDYQKIWKPLCEMESACSAVAENESIIIEDAELKWNNSKDRLKGSFRLPLEKKAQWAIDGNLRNCFLCIRLRIQQHDISPLLEDSLTDSQDLNLMDVPGLIWIAHGVVTKVSGEEESKELTYMEIDFRINHMPMTNIPDQVFRESARFTVELIPKLLPDVRKENAIENLTTSNQLVKAIAIGKKTQDRRSKINQSRFEIENHRSFGFPKLNNSQSKAIKEALSNEFTLIQGPPGTGKTVVGVHIVYWFFQENQKLPHLQRVKNEDAKKQCILYCGPSNKSVDVVAGQLLKLQGKLKPLRVYSDQMEILEFPYPGSTLKLSRHSKRVEKPNKELRPITLHHRIRGADNPYSAQIQAFDLKFQRDQYLTDEEMRSYKDCLKKARKHELLQHDVILCTCTAASHPILADVLNFQQIVIDECAMATEPEAFIPLVTHKPKKIVLLGDHKQLQPVVHCELLQRLGMRQSLFERYMRKALMLDTQYRMQEDICAFPSQEFYEGKLKTGIPYRQSVFMNRFNSATSIIFGHVEGKEQSLVVSTDRGNENSKANIEEAEEAVRTARFLIRAGIRANEIAILTPYNAQVANIKDIWEKYNTKCITVNTIMKSQGSEWRYVILSTVRSCPASDIETEPTKAWLKKRLGFVMDPHQVNVGITRAQEGLCIIGNRDLLQCNYLWRKLLNHYEEKSCVVDPARHIQIARA